ncbi:MAG: N-acetyl-gamma-glutamyl-phosphate reductase [Candidatus Omnitrophica bacterium]|nr:N-acetyl-gamma-glutamyl-phosphate reductase [Candidatus Omnitrophota bacterium]
MIKVGIVGISGYSGLATFKILMNHPDVCVTYVSANNTQGSLDEIWPELKGQTSLVCKKFDLKKAALKCELIFLAVPHTTSMTLTPKLLAKKIRVIDLSGDYRLKSAAKFEEWYGKAHKDAGRLAKTIYGLPEIYRAKIQKANFIANPGCYPTAALLGLAPLASIHTNLVELIIIDAKSGVSGAGKKIAKQLMYCAVNENFKAYKVLEHQHTPEIEQYLSLIAEKPMSITFVPHLLPINHGILETIYVKLNKRMNLDRIHKMYSKFYKTEPFVRVLTQGTQPQIKNVVGTNICEIGLAVSKKKDMLVITSVIDNLIKGAAGQAVQNMNIMYGFKETQGLFQK